MPVGIKNGPAIFQCVMDHVLQGLDCEDVYIDDIIIGSAVETEEELLANHDRDVRAVLDRLRNDELVASVSKTDFSVRSVSIWWPCVRKWHTPASARGMLVLERCEKPDNIRNKNGKKKGLTWNASANEAFLKLKRAITDIVPLQLADWDKDFVLSPGASSWAVTAALKREGPDGALRPLAFFSRELSGSQLN